MTNQSSVEAVRADVAAIRDILYAIEKESGRCRELARMGDPDGAEHSLARARDLYSELLAAVDFENPVHRSMTRNRRADLGTMAAEVESCRLKKETDRTRLQRKKAPV